MNIKYLSICGFLAVAAMSTPLGFAQTAGSGLDKIENWNQRNEEIKQAGKAVQSLNMNSADLQKSVDGINKQKADQQREVDYDQTRLDTATKQLDFVNKLVPPDPDAVKSAEKEADYWRSRLELAKTTLVKVDSDLKKSVDDYRKALLEPMTSKLILPGEVLQLFVLEDESFNGLYQVRSGGYIILPRVGRVSVAGKDINGAEKAIKDELEKTQLKQGTVQLERSAGVYSEENTDVIYLAGEFKTTGPLKTPVGITPTLVTTIIRAGQLTPQADLTRVKLLRLEGGHSLVEEVNVQAILDGAGQESDLALNSGDIVVVPSFSPIIYVTGNVNKPSAIKLTTDTELTAYSAILICDGFARFAKLTGVYVLRDRGNGEKSRIPVNIKAVQAGKTPDVILQGKDIVVVPEKFFSW